MDTPARLQEIAEHLESHGYTCSPTDDYLHGLATRLRNAGWDVEDPDDDDGAQAAANAGEDQPARDRTSRRAPGARKAAKKAAAPAAAPAAETPTT